MTPADRDAAAELLKNARLNGEVIPEIPVGIRPKSQEEAYDVQDRLAESLGWEVGGWFCGCTNRSIQIMLDLNEPYCARLFKQLIHAEPATLSASDFPPMVLECEFAFSLKDDLPSRPTPYSRDEVEDAVEALHPSIEVVAGYIKDWMQQDIWSVIADNGTDGALVYGAGVTDWQALNLKEMEVTLERKGKVERRGHGKNILGDPVEALVWLANHRSQHGDGLKAGHIHNTGTATDIFRVRPGDQVVARFDGLGEVNLTISR